MTSHSEDYMLPPSDEQPPEEFVPMHKPPPEFVKGDIGPSCSPGANGRPGANGPARGAADIEVPHAVFEDVMLDIETMSLHPNNALILSIGMVEFDPRGDEFKLGRQMLITPDIVHQLLIGRHVDRGTQKFWGQQSPDAADHWLHAESRWPLKASALAIKSFLSNGARRLWANGIIFDLGNVASLCEQADVEAPWHYRAPRDARTFWEQTPVRRLIEIGDALDFHVARAFVAHEPLSDCITQAHRVWQHWPEGTI